MLKSRGRNCEPLNLAPGFQTFLRGVLHTLDCVTKHVHFKVLRGILRIGAEQREGSAASAESRAQRRRPTVSAFENRFLQTTKAVLTLRIPSYLILYTVLQLATFLFSRTLFAASFDWHYSLHVFHEFECNMNCTMGDAAFTKSIPLDHEYCTALQKGIH